MSCAGFLVHGFMILYICMKIADGRSAPRETDLRAGDLHFCLCASDHRLRPCGKCKLRLSERPVAWLAPRLHRVGLRIRHRILTSAMRCLFSESCPQLSAFAAARILLRKLSSSIQIRTWALGDSPTETKNFFAVGTVPRGISNIYITFAMFSIGGGQYG